MGRLRAGGTSAVLAALVGMAAGVAAVGPGASAARAASPVSVYPLGDSITFGTSGWANTPGGYRGTLLSDLSSDGVQIRYQGTSTANPPATFDTSAYEHDGHPGFRIDQVAADLDHSDASAGSDGGDWVTGDSSHRSIRPQVVVLLIGTNDVLQSFDPGRRYPGGYDGSVEWERNQFVADMTGRLWWLLRELGQLDPGMRLVLCTIPPIGIHDHDPTATAYDRALRQRVVPTARLMGMRVALADVEPVFLAQPSDQAGLIGPDGVHPTPVGYSRMAGVIAGAVVQLVRSH